MIKKIGIVGGGISGLVTAIFLAREGYKVSIFEKNFLLSETSSKTTKLLHGGLRYLENFHFKEVKNGLECGISLKDFIDFKEKDVIESYLAEEVQRSI